VDGGFTNGELEIVWIRLFRQCGFDLNTPNLANLVVFNKEIVAQIDHRHRDDVAANREFTSYYGFASETNMVRCQDPSPKNLTPEFSGAGTAEFVRT